MSKSKDTNSSSWWKKLLSFFKLSSAEDESESGGSTGRLTGQGFIDPKTAILGSTNDSLYVKNPETVLYNESQKDPLTIKELHALTNGQIPISEAAALYEKAKSSESSLHAIVNSEYTPAEIKRKARHELQRLETERRSKLQEQAGLKPEPPKPGGPSF